jgi:hypothetical protein
LDALQTIRFIVVFVLCGIAGAHAFSVHMLQSQLVFSMKRMVYLVYSILLGIFSVFGFLLMSVSISFADATIKAPAYEGLGLMLLLAYGVLATGLSDRFIKH